MNELNKRIVFGFSALASNAYKYLQAIRPQHGVIVLLFCLIFIVSLDALGDVNDVNSDVVSPIITYQYFDALDNADYQNITSQIVTYQYLDSLTDVTCQTLTSPSVSYFFPCSDITSPADPPTPNILSAVCDEFIITAPPDKNKLVIITHGWSPLWETPNADWVTNMVNAINGVVDNSVWVQPYYWLDACHTYYPPDALANGMERGSLLGRCIADANQWQHVHLVGHSAGAGVIFAAANELVRQRAMGKFSGTIHLTFLDPYSPSTIANAYTSVLGPNDWADNYYTYDITDIPFNGETSKNFNSAYNVDLRNINFKLIKSCNWLAHNCIQIK